jgi:transposase
MQSIGLDVHKSHTQVEQLAEDGEVHSKRIRTERGALVRYFGSLAPSRVLLESSTESEWVARVLEEQGHEVIVADPNFAPMYLERVRRVKTDRRDAQALAEACRLGAYRKAHRLSDSSRQLRAELRVREALVRTRAGYIVLLRSLLRQEGLRVRSGSAPTFEERLREVEMSQELATRLAPLRSMFGELNERIAAADRELERLARRDGRVRRLCTVPGVGPVTAAVFVATIDRADRFGSAKQVCSYVGLVPSESSSAERRYRGRITRKGSERLRSLLVEAAWGVWRSKNEESEGLRAWAQEIAARRGKAKATVALARKLAGILWAVWRDGSSFKAPQPRDVSAA